MVERINHAPSTVLYPSEVLDYKVTRASGNLVHPIIGRSNPDVTFAVPGFRKGVLKTVWPSDATAAAAWAEHMLTGTFQLTSDARPSINMYYVPDGECTQEYDHDAGVWLLMVPFSEVLP